MTTLTLDELFQITGGQYRGDAKQRPLGTVRPDEYREHIEKPVYQPNQGEQLLHYL